MEFSVSNCDVRPNNSSGAQFSRVRLELKVGQLSYFNIAAVTIAFSKILTPTDPLFCLCPISSTFHSHQAREQEPIQEGVDMIQAAVRRTPKAEGTVVTTEKVGFSSCPYLTDNCYHLCASSHHNTPFTLSTTIPVYLHLRCTASR